MDDDLRMTPTTMAPIVIITNGAWILRAPEIKTQSIQKTGLLRG